VYFTKQSKKYVKGKLNQRISKLWQNER